MTVARSLLHCHLSSRREQMSVSTAGRQMTPKDYPANALRLFPFSPLAVPPLNFLSPFLILANFFSLFYRRRLSSSFTLSKFFFSFCIFIISFFFLCVLVVFLFFSSYPFLVSFHYQFFTLTLFRFYLIFSSYGSGFILI